MPAATGRMIYLDTHVVAWLYAGRVDLLPGRARELIDAHELLISPLVVLELQYLYETGRLGEPAEPIVAALARELGLRQCDLPFGEVVAEALGQAWTRDPFDRVIVAHARLRQAPLLTRDRAIHAHHEGSVWE